VCKTREERFDRELERKILAIGFRDGEGEKSVSVIRESLG
jgi:hypothetical protein